MRYCKNGKKRKKTPEEIIERLRKLSATIIEEL